MRGTAPPADMRIFSGTLAFFRNVLVAGDPESGGTVATEETPGPKPEPKPAAEFDDLLESLDAVLPATDDSRIFSLKDETIAELQRMLETLRPVGEKLAETEQRRLAAVARIAELEGEWEAARKTGYEFRIETARLRVEIEKQDRKLADKETALNRANERLAKAREKYEERKRVAAERWKEIRKLRASKRALERELEECRASRGDDPATGPEPDRT